MVCEECGGGRFEYAGVSAGEVRLRCTRCTRTTVVAAAPPVPGRPLARA